MGKKYIVELGERQRLYKTELDYTSGVRLVPVSITPYTEPDLERVKKTAHDDGYSEGYQAGREDLNRVMSDVEQIRKEAYAEGLKDVVFANIKVNIPG